MLKPKNKNAFPLYLEFIILSAFGNTQPLPSKAENKTLKNKLCDYAVPTRGSALVLVVAVDFYYFIGLITTIDQCLSWPLLLL